MTGEVFKLHVLPAGIGDALVLDYGTADMISRVVIDGGVGKTAGPLAEFPRADTEDRNVDDHPRRQRPHRGCSEDAGRWAQPAYDR